MHCPNCGTETSAGQKFCRACGLSLERIAQLLAELLPEDQPRIAISVTEQTTARLGEKIVPSH